MMMFSFKKLKEEKEAVAAHHKNYESERNRLNARDYADRLHQAVEIINNVWEQVVPYPEKRQYASDCIVKTTLNICGEEVRLEMLFCADSKTPNKVTIVPPVESDNE